MTAGQAKKAIKYNLVQGHRLSHILRALRMPKSTYYYWKKHHPTYRQRQNVLLKRQITKLWYRNHYIYGYPRMKIALDRNGFHISARRAWKLMHELGIHSIMNKKLVKPHTHNDYPQRPNLIKNRDWTNAWCGDITYIRLMTGKWVYLASVYNPNTHHIIAYQIEPHMTDKLVTSVMKEALKTTSSAQHPLIMHTDMGSQYTSDEFENYLIRHQLRHSYSRKGYPYDNTYIENFHSLLKKEWTFHHQYHNIYEARASIGSYIKWYNTNRISLVS